MQSSERRKLFGVIFVIGAFVLAFMIARIVVTGRPPMGHANLVGVAAIVLASALGLAWFLRRRGGQNAAGSSLLIAILAALSAVLANRVIGMLAETALPAILATDCVIYASALVGTRAIAPRLSWLSGWITLGAMGCMGLPDHASAVFALTVLSAIAMLLARWSWFMRRGGSVELSPRQDD